jgi:hypothetical protein
MIKNNHRDQGFAPQALGAPVILFLPCDTSGMGIFAEPIQTFVCEKT